MEDLTTCLKYAVGLAKTECDCDSEGIPDDFDRSDSGYYLDDMELAPALQFPKSSVDCQSFWTMMETAREQGIRDFMTDFLVKSKMYTNIKVSPYDGEFSDNKKINRVVSGITKDTLVAMYKPIKYVRGAVMEVRKVGLILNLPGTYTVKVYKSSDMVTPVKTIDVTVTTSQVLATADVPSGDGGVWRLPMWEDANKLTYYFAYDRNGSSPWNIRFNCGCTNGTKAWEKHLFAKGIQTDDITQLEINTPSYSHYSYGLYVYGSLTCEGFEWMCRDWNYKTDSFARVMARLIQLNSIRKLHALILNSRRINAYTLLKPETMQARIAGLGQMIDDPVQGNIGYLFNNIPRGVTGCWECRSQFSKRTIRI